MMTESLPYHELPLLNSSMFRESGTIDLYQKTVEAVSSEWKLDLWQEVFEFYCRLNDMEWSAFQRTDYSYHIQWKSHSHKKHGL